MNRRAIVWDELAKILLALAGLILALFLISGRIPFMQRILDFFRRGPMF